MQTILANQVYKQFGKKTVLDGLDLSIEGGSVVGLLGRNGAGKTTLNRIMTGLSFPSKGEVLICGEKPKCGSGKISFLSENISVFPYLTAAENLEQVFFLNRLTPDQKRIQGILEEISIENSKKKVANFSLGMKRRLQVAMAVLVVDREIMILDEPTNGLDINGVLWLKELLLQLKKKERTLIVTSHAISELESVLSHYAILSKGKIVEFGSVSAMGNQGVLFTLNRDEIDKAKLCFEQNSIEFEQLDAERVLIPNTEESSVHRYLQMLLNYGVVPMQFSLKKNSLVDLFVSYAKEDNRDETDR